MYLSILSLAIVFCSFSLFAVLAKNPIHSILSLVFVFFAAACFSLILGVEFLALLFLIVYVGAIAVLFLFVVMLLNIRIVEVTTSMVKYWWLGFLMSIFFLFGIYITLSEVFFFNSTVIVPLTYTDFVWNLYESNIIGVMGECLFLFFPNFLIVAVFLLLIAVIFPVVLTYINFLNTGKNIDSDNSVQKRQNIFAQTFIYS